jgi:class 3 adenylate cyclase
MSQATRGSWGSTRSAPPARSANTAFTDALVAKHGGRLVKTTGDGVLLEFPSVVDAVECAVTVQVVMAERNQGVPEDRRMLFRIGVNLGDILIEGDDFLDDGANVAARLERAAEPGRISSSASRSAARSTREVWARHGSWRPYPPQGLTRSVARASESLLSRFSGDLQIGQPLQRIDARD